MAIDYLGVLHGTLALNVIATAYRCNILANLSKWILPRAARRNLSKREQHQQEELQQQQQLVAVDKENEKDDIEMSSSSAIMKDEATPLSSSHSATKSGEQKTIFRRATSSIISNSESWEDTPTTTSNIQSSSSRTKSICQKVPYCSSIMSCMDNNDMAKRHRNLLYFTYLPVYLFATAADWLQGPYKYAVYSAYGYDQRAIAFLFVAGYGSGMSVGSIVGGLADSWGRKRTACMYCVVYTFSCLAKHVRHFGVLLIGRILGGIATSLLFSVFDSWLIKAHANRNIDKSYLAKSFSAANYGSSIVAIVAGLIANSFVGEEGDHPLQPMFSKEMLLLDGWKVNPALIGATTTIAAAAGGDGDSNGAKEWNHILYTGGGIRAFDLALLALFICFVLCIFVWDENYGDDSSSSLSLSSSPPKSLSSSTSESQLTTTITTTTSPSAGGGRKGKNHHKIGMFSALRSASLTVWRSPDIFNLCVISSFFEGSMYVFIFHWTPALRALDDKDGSSPDGSGSGGPPLGTIFATFMVCCMLGTSAFSILTSAGITPSRVLVYALSLSSLSCAAVSVSSRLDVSYAALLLFEGCIGAYYPAMSTIKGMVVPEDQRAAIYNVFRLPLNFVVLINLLTNLTFKQSFGLCCSMLAVASFLMTRETRLDNSNNNTKEEEEDSSTAATNETDNLLNGDHHHGEEMTPIMNPNEEDFEDGFSKVLPSAPMSGNGLGPRKLAKIKAEV